MGPHPPRARDGHARAPHRRRAHGDQHGQPPLHLLLVDDASAIDLSIFGPAHEHHPLFPQRTNVQVAQILSPTHIRMRVWERGTGITLASGSSSCATAVAAARRGLAEREVTITLDGGDLRVAWRDDGVWMTGPTAHVFTGTLTPAFLDSL